MAQIFTDTHLYSYPGVQKLKQKCKVLSVLICVICERLAI